MRGAPMRGRSKIKVGDMVISNDLSERGDEFDRLFADPFHMDWEVDPYVLWFPSSALVLEVKPAPWSKAKIIAGDKIGWIWMDHLEVLA